MAKDYILSYEQYKWKDALSRYARAKLALKLIAKLRCYDPSRQVPGEQYWNLSTRIIALN